MQNPSKPATVSLEECHEGVQLASFRALGLSDTTAWTRRTRGGGDDASATRGHPDHHTT